MDPFYWKDIGSRKQWVHSFFFLYVIIFREREWRREREREREMKRDEREKERERVRKRLRKAKALKVRSYKWLVTMKRRLKVFNGLLACLFWLCESDLNHDWVILRAYIFFLNNPLKLHVKVELRQSFPTCVYCMHLRFQSNYAGLSQPKVVTLKMQTHAVNARWKRLSQLSLKHS